MLQLRENPYFLMNTYEGLINSARRSLSREEYKGRNFV